MPLYDYPHFTAKISGSLTRTSYDIYNDGSNDDSSIISRVTNLQETQQINIDGITKITITNDGNKTGDIAEIRIKLGDKIVKKYVYSYSQQEMGYTNPTQVRIPFNSENKTFAIDFENLVTSNGNTYFTRTGVIHTGVWGTTFNFREFYVQTTYTPTFDTAGYKGLYVELVFTDNTNYEFYVTDLRNSPANVQAYNPILASLQIHSSSTHKKRFAIGDAFDYAGLVVRARYDFAIKTGYTALTAQIENYGISSPDMNSSGSKTVTVTYGDKTASYYITVYGKSNATITYETPSKIKFKKGESISGYTASVTIVYKDLDNNTLKTVTQDLGVSTTQLENLQNLFDGMTASYLQGNITYSGNVYGESYSTTWSITCYNMSAINHDNSTMQTAYSVGDTVNKSGLVTNLTFGEAGSVTVTDENIEIDDLDSSSTGTKLLETRTTYLGNIYTSSKIVYVNGVCDMKVDVSACSTYNSAENYIEVPKGASIMDYLAGRVLYYKTFTNGTTSEWTSGYTGEITYSYDSNITATTGKKTLTFSIENGRLTYSIDIMVYAVDSLSVSGMDTNKYVVGGVYPKFNSSNLVVVANRSDGVTQTLNSSEYTISKTNDTAYELGDNKIIIKLATDNSIQYEFNVYVEADNPKDDATLTITSDLPIYVENGYKVEKNKIHVVVSETESGSLNKQWDDFEIEVYDSEDTLVSNQTLTSGAYTIHVKVATGTLDENHEMIYLEDSNQDITITVNYITQVKGKLITSGEHKNSVDGFVLMEDSFYKVGETFDITTIKATKVWSNGYEEDVVVADIADPNATVSTSDVGAIAKNVSVTICGFTKTIHLHCFKLCSATIILSKNKYDITDSLDFNEVRIVKDYDQGSGTKTLKYVHDNYYEDKTFRTPLQEELTQEELEALTYTFSSTDTSCSVGSLKPNLARDTALVTFTTSVTESGVTVTSSTASISVKHIKNAKLYKDSVEVTSINKNYGNKLNLYGYVVQIMYNEYDFANSQNSVLQESITLDEENILNYITSFENNGALKDDTTLQFSVTYKNKDYTTISVTTYVTKLDSTTFNLLSVFTNNEVMYGGHSLDLSTLTASAEYKASNTAVGEEITISNSNDYQATMNGEVVTGALSFEFDSQIIEDGYIIPNPSQEASKKLKVWYRDSLGQEDSEEVQLTIKPNIPSHISVDTTNLVDMSAYYVDDYLNVSGVTVTLVYTDGTTRVLANEEWLLVDSATNPVNKTKQLVVGDNNKALYIKYGDLTSVSLGTLTVSPKEVKQIQIIQNPSKTTFTIGDKFTAKGLVIKATYKGNSALTESIMFGDSGIAISGISLNHVIAASDYDTDNGDIVETTETITVTFTDGNNHSVTTTYSVTLALPVLDHLRLDTSAVQITFTDTQAFNSTGLIMYAVYENGYEETVSSPSSYFTNTVQGQAPLYLDSNGKIQVHSNGADYGIKTLTLSYTSPYDNSTTKTISYEVNVLTSGAIQSAVLEFDDTLKPYEYLVGEKYNARGIRIKWVDVDGETGYSTDFETTPAIDTLFRKAQRINVKVVFTRGSYMNELYYDIQVLIPNTVNLVDTNDYKIAIGYSSNGILFETMNDTDGREIKLGLQEDGSRFYPIFHENNVSIDTNNLHEDTYGYNVYTGNNLQQDAIGYMDMGLVDEFGNNVRNAHVILFEDITNPIDADNNVVVTYPHFIEEYANKINQCKFGIIYNKHLFVSGNNEFKNLDWHSESSDKITDLTYFSDLDYCAYGSDDTAVVGYDIYRDGELVVFKQPSRNEATLYRRVAQLITAIDYQGNTIDGNYEDAYPCYDINFNGGDGAIDYRSIINFVGDTLFLTKNGLKVLTSKDTTYNKEKIVYDVSSAINVKILEEDVENIHLFAFKERLLLKTNRGLYVGEYNLRNEDTKEYEWYFLDNINADVFFEFEDELYFADDNGNVYKFVADNSELADFKDNSRVFIGIGGTLLNHNQDSSNNDGFEIDANNNYIIVSKDYANDIVDGRDFHLITTYLLSGADNKSIIHASLGNFINDNARINNYDAVNNSSFDTTAYVGLMNYERSSIKVEPYLNRNDINYTKLFDIQDTFYDGQVVYFDNIIGTNPVVYTDTRYVLKQLKDSNGNDVVNEYVVYDIYGHIVDLTGVTTLRISIAVNELAVTKITQSEPYNEDGAMKFRLLGLAGKVLDLIYYNGRDDRYSGVITNPQNVKAYYMTKPFDMGTQIYDKTIKQWGIVNDTDLESQMDVGYLSSSKQGTYRNVIETASGSKGLDFGNFNFNKVQFTSDELPHIYTRIRTLARVGFIKYIFKNDEDTNMVLTQLNIVYTVNGKIVGGK